jgi:hypothetical protein
MSRYQAFLYHFIISFALFVVLAYIILFHWYPGFFYSIDGGWEGMRIIIGVELVLGPLLTLVVFKPGKPGLKFDLSLIAILQVVCLSLGLYIVYNERPIFFVYYEKHFYSSSKDTYANYQLTAPDPYQYAAKTPASVISVLPENPIEEADFRLVLFKGGIPPWAYGRTYKKLEGHLDEVVTQGVSEDVLLARDREGNLKAWLSEYGGTFNDYAFIPIHSRYRDAFLGIRKSDKSFVDIVEIPPPM